MFKRKLFKRVLPIILSVAMTFQSVPATALAAESQVESSAELETGQGEDPASQDSGGSTEKAPEAEAGSTEAVESTEMLETASGESVEPSTVETGSEQKTEETSSTTSTETSDTEMSSTEAPETEASDTMLIVAEGADETTGEGASEKVAAIVVDDQKANNIDGFTRKLGEKGLAYFTEYKEMSQCGTFEKKVKECISVTVGDEEVSSLNDQFTYSWAVKNADGTETPLTDALPTDAGDYVLTVGLESDKIVGLYDKVESLKVALTIEKAEITLDIADVTIDPGRTAQDLIDQINKAYTLEYKNKSDEKFTVSRDILDIKDAAGNADPDKKLPLDIFVIDSDGIRKPMSTTAGEDGKIESFDRNKSYILTIGSISLTADAAKNYELETEKSYTITVGDLRDTEIRFTLADVGRDLVEIYNPEKAWTIEEVTENLFAPEQKDAAGNIISHDGAPTVFVEDEDGKETALKVYNPKAETQEEDFTAGWYTRVHVEDWKYADKDEGELESYIDGKKYIYKPAEDPAETGEYYIIYSYAGDDKVYEESTSVENPIRFTIDPQPVTVKILRKEGSTGDRTTVDDEGLFCDGMTADDVKAALAKVSYDVCYTVKNESGAEEEKVLETAPDFFGAINTGDVNKKDTRYYVPELILERRISRIEEKNGAVTDFDTEEASRAVDWELFSGTLNLKLEGDALRGIKLPSDMKSDQLKSVTFKYRVRFTGNKVVYNTEGNKIEIGGKKAIPITDVTTNAANRNYLVDISKSTLENEKYSAVEVQVAQAKDVVINTDAIKESFKTENKPEDGGTLIADEAADGTFAKPLTKIYDARALFNERASYKQAAVFEKNAEDGGQGTKLEGVDYTHEALTYRWDSVSLEKYEDVFRQWDEEQQKYKDFEDYFNSVEDEMQWTINPEDGSLCSLKDAGLYRLTITYSDKEHKYGDAEAEVYFKVERQEIVIVPAQDWYFNYGSSIPDGLSGGKIGKDFTIYKLPYDSSTNSFKEYDELDEEAKKACKIVPTDEAIAEYEAKEGRPFDKGLDDLEWVVLRRERDPQTGELTDNWIEPDEIESFDKDFTYGVAAYWNESRSAEASICDEEYNNYTTLNVKTFRETGERKHHKSVGAVKFYDEMIYVEADAAKIKALGHPYNGEPIDLAKVADALTFYSDKALTNVLPKEIVNTTNEYNPNKINIYWKKNGSTYTNENAVYGGTYELVLRFDGGELKTTEDAPETTQEDTASKVYAPYSSSALTYINMPEGETKAAFTITPIDITIKPALKEKTFIVAGETADKLLTRGLDLEGSGVLEKDMAFFGYQELAAGSFDKTIIFNGNLDGTDKEGCAYRYNIDKAGGYPAFNAGARYIIQVDGRDIKAPADEYLRYGSTYTVKLTNTLAAPLSDSYNVTFGTAEAEVGQRGLASVTKIDDNISAKRIDFDYSEESGYTVKPRGAVKFYSNLSLIGKNGNKTLNNVNVLGFRIYAPQEYRNFDNDELNFIYQNAVWEAGGYFYNDKKVQGNKTNGYYIDVAFPLTKEDVTSKDRKSFTIIWENGATVEETYAEAFTLGDFVLEEDLTKAVAPKSIKFNGVQTKMAVGETQQLDLKITKAQLGDVIKIRYRLKEDVKKGEVLDPERDMPTCNEYVSVDPETGVVTALMTGKGASATIEAYPVYENARGRFVPVLDSKGKEAKAASVKITVTEVGSPAIKKIETQGSKAKVYFTVPDNGYRREIYVVDVTKNIGNEAAKKWKAAQFNDAIDGMKNGQWKEAGFAQAPVYNYAENKNVETLDSDKYDTKLKAHIESIGNLNPEHEYVIYIRNVSRIKTLDDGSVVAFSAAGAVKGFKTTKPMVKSLKLDFTIKADEKDKKNTVTHPVKEDGTIDVDKYEVELSAKKAQLNVYGYFFDREGGNDAAEVDDQRRYSLIPSLKEEKADLKKYLAPKLEFAVYDDTNGTAFDPARAQSKYAAVSKKGLVTLKGVDLNGEKTVYIYVRDSIQDYVDKDGKVRNDTLKKIELTITAKAYAVKGKAAKLKVGQTIRLSDYLEYSDAKKKKIPNYRSCGVTITDEVIADAKAKGYRIEARDAGYPVKYNDWYITAIAPNKAKFALTVNDFGADGSAEDGGKAALETTVTLTSAAIDGVKGLKVTYVDDKYITINFTNPADNNSVYDAKGSFKGTYTSVYQYAVEIKDARGNIVDKVIIGNPNIVSNIDYADSKELKAAQSWIQFTDVTINQKTKKVKVTGNANKYENYVPAFNYYAGTKAKAKTFAYTYKNEKLVRLSAYTVSVTPLYGKEQAAKPATAKTKTTNIPASYNNPDLTGDPVYDRRGGNKLIYTTGRAQETADGSNVGNQSINNVKGDAPEGYKFTSGNTYTLKLGDVNANKNATIARDRVTDTLTWKSSNTKVATVKANAGTYTATFKALSKGTTTITVTSKITKKVIARWKLTVCAVKDGTGYGGDYEPTWTNGFYENILALFDPEYEGRLEVVSMNVPFNINPAKETWFSFTAPHYGTYKITDNGVGVDHVFDSKNGIVLLFVENLNNERIYALEANQKVYFKASRKALVTGNENLVRLTKNHTEDKPLEVKANSYVSLTAWEDNHYTVWMNGTERDDDFKDVYMNAGETKYILAGTDCKMYVTCHEAKKALTLTDAAYEATLDWKNQEVYASFTANIDGVYEFTYPSNDGVEVSFTKANGGSLTAIEDSAAVEGDKKTFSERYRLEQDEKVFIKFKADPQITDAAKMLTSSVKVAMVGERRELKLDDAGLDIPRGTTEIVKFVIPAFGTEKAKYSFVVTGGEGESKIETYYDEDYNDKSNKFISNSITLKKDAGKTEKLQAGKTIYIRVTAGIDETITKPEEQKNAKLVVTRTLPTELKLTDKTAQDSVAMTNGTEKWYTFTAPSAGWYELDVKVAEEPADNPDNRNKHTAKITYDDVAKLFDETLNSNNVVNSTSEGRIVKMKAGNKVTIKLEQTGSEQLKPLPDGAAEDAEPESAESDVTVSVKQLTITPLTEGTEMKVDDSKEIRYYSFTALADDTYDISWIPDDQNVDNAKVTTGTSMPISQEEAMGMYTLTAGNVRYIRVAPGSKEGDIYKVAGKLLVKATNLKAAQLTLDSPADFDLEKGKTESQVFKFTAPKNGYYVVTTTVGTNDATQLPYEYPSIGKGIIVSTPSGTINTPDETKPEGVPKSFKKGETIYLTLSLNGDKTVGTITVSYKENPLNADADVTVEKDVSKTYTWIVPASGRYKFPEYDKELKADIKWSSGNVECISGNYYRKNEELTVTITGEGEDAPTTVKLGAPALITPEEIVKLQAGTNTLTVPAGETRYYELTAANVVTYRLDITAKGGTLETTWAKNDGSLSTPESWYVGLREKGTLFIKAENTSPVRASEYTLDIVMNKELKLGENIISLDKGESVSLTYRAKETGYYAISIDQPGAELVFDDKPNDKFYQDLAKITAKDPQTWTLKNEGSKTDVTVIVKQVTLTPVEPDKEVAPVAIGAGETAYFALKTFKSADYIMKLKDETTGKDLTVQYLKKVLEDWEEMSYKQTGTEPDAELWYEFDEHDAERIVKITNNHPKDTRNVKIMLTKSEAQPLTDQPITLNKNETRKFSYVAKEDGRYLITMKNEKVSLTIEKRFINGGRELPVSVEKCKEVILSKGDKLIGTLSYTPDANDKKATASQTVNVTIEPITPKPFTLEPVTITETDNKSAWYEFTADEESVYTFTLEDANGNEVSDALKFYDYIYAASESKNQNSTGRYMKKAEKVCINVNYPDEGTYTLKYTKTEATKINGEGRTVLDFEYNAEVKKVTFVVPNPGIYKISQKAIKGTFDTLKAECGGTSVFASGETDGMTNLLKKDDVVIITVKSLTNGKASASLRIEAVSKAEDFTGKVDTTSDTENDTYYQMRITKKGIYAITASGAPTVQYYVNDDAAVTVNGISYKKLDVDDRITLKVGKTSAGEQRYAITVEEVTPVAIGTDTTAEKTFDITGTGYYSITPDKDVYAAYTAKAGTYKIKVELVDPPESPARSWIIKDGDNILANDSSVTLAGDGKITFELPKKAGNSDSNVKDKTEIYKFIIEKVTAPTEDDLKLALGAVKDGELEPGDSRTYTFKASEAAKYILSSNNSGCMVTSADGSVESLAADAEWPITVRNNGTKTGYFSLKVEKLAPTQLTDGTTGLKTLKPGETEYYEFTAGEPATGETATKYLIYTSGDSDIEIKKVAKADGATENVPSGDEKSLAKDDKLEIEVTNLNSKTNGANTSYKVTVKRVEYKPVTANTPETSVQLDTNEIAYYEFTCAEEKGADYQVSIDQSRYSVDASLDVEKVEIIKDADGKVTSETSENVTVTGKTSEKATLKNGDKLRIKVTGNTAKATSFDLMVEKIEPEKPTEPVTIAVGAKEKFSLYEGQKAVYVFEPTVDKNGKTYSVYLTGDNWTVEQTTTTTAEDGKETPEVGTLTVTTPGSTEFTCMNDSEGKVRDNKVTFTATKAGTYTLELKEVTYTTLTLGDKVEKTLRANETLYYDFTAAAPAEGTETTKYILTGASMVREATKDAEGKLILGSWNSVLDRHEVELKEGEKLYIQLTNSDESAAEMTLTIDKEKSSADYDKTLTLGQREEISLKSGEKAYYKFVGGTPAEGSETTTYQIYGTAPKDVKKVSLGEDGKLGAPEDTYAPYTLKEKEELLITVTGSGSLTVAGTTPKPFTPGAAPIKTGALEKGQKVIYEYKHTDDKAVTYVVDKTKVPSSVAFVSSAIGGEVTLAKDQTLTITITATEEVADVEFTVSEAPKPEELSLGLMQTAKVLKAGESVSYEYQVPDKGDGNYALAFVRSSGNVACEYEIVKAAADGAATASYTSVTAGNIIDLTDLKKDDAVNIRVTNSSSGAKASFKLNLQKADYESWTTGDKILELQGGEVKYYKFALTDEQKNAEEKYLVSFNSRAVNLRYDGDIDAQTDYTIIDKNNPEFVLSVYNPSMTKKETCVINIQEYKPIAMGEYSGVLTPGESKYFILPGSRKTVKGTDGKLETEVVSYYQSVATDGDRCDIIYLNEPERSFSSGMNYWNDHYNDYIVKVSNPRRDGDSSEDESDGSGENKNVSRSYKFSLKDAWKSITAASTDECTKLEGAETAYYAVTAPAEKSLYVMVSSKGSKKLKWSDTKPDIVNDGANSNWTLNGPFEVEAGKTYYFSVANLDSKFSGFTFSVAETIPDIVQLEMNGGESVISKTVLTKDKTVTYEFTAPKTGRYVITSDLECTYKKGEQDVTIASGGLYDLDLKETEKITFSAKCTPESGEKSACYVRVEYLRDVTLCDMAGQPYRLQFKTGDTDRRWLQINVEEAGTYKVRATATAGGAYRIKYYLSSVSSDEWGDYLGGFTTSTSEVTFTLDTAQTIYIRITPQWQSDSTVEFTLTKDNPSTENPN